jgi:hypothetical protein
MMSREALREWIIFQKIPLWKLVKLPAHRAELPGKEISFLVVPPDPA